VILAGDVGGTKTTVALFDRGRLVREVTVASRDYDSLEAVIARFLEGRPRPVIGALAVGIAGPVVDGRGTTTNLVACRRARAGGRRPCRPRASAERP
jgi:glucokinase